MSLLIDEFVNSNRSHTVIENSYIDIHYDPNRNVEDIVEYIDDNFGILYIKLNKTNVIKTPIHLLFTVDITLSMYGSKIKSLKKTLINIVDYFAEKSDILEIYISIHTFNTDVVILIDNIKVTDENKDIIQKNIQEIDVVGCTDIGIALSACADSLSKYKENYPTHNVGHIFMTDGQPTAGIIDESVLSSFIDNRYTNIIIGFGEDHNANLLLKISENHNTEYHFIENFKNIGFVYGEILHKFLYPAVENIILNIEYGLIYDWKTNNWVTSIQDNTFISDVEKTYHIRTEDPSMVTVMLYGNTYDSTGIKYNVTRLLDIITPLPKLINTSTLMFLYNDLSKYIFRQKIQELLYQAIKISNSRKNNKTGYKQKVVEYKKELIICFKKIRKYMRESNLFDDPFMINLCDDIKVIYSKLNSKVSTMYLSARQSSHGRQQSYTVNIDEEFSEELQIPTNKYSFTNTSYYFDDDDICKSLEEIGLINTDLSFDSKLYEQYDEDDIENYTSSIGNTSCYSTETVLDTMRKINKNDI